MSLCDKLHMIMAENQKIPSISHYLDILIYYYHLQYGLKIFVLQPLFNFHRDSHFNLDQKKDISEFIITRICITTLSVVQKQTG